MSKRLADSASCYLKAEHYPDANRLLERALHLAPTPELMGEIAKLKRDCRQAQKKRRWR